MLSVYIAFERDRARLGSHHLGNPKAPDARYVEGGPRLTGLHMDGVEDYQLRTADDETPNYLHQC